MMVLHVDEERIRVFAPNLAEPLADVYDLVCTCDSVGALFHTSNALYYLCRLLFMANILVSIWSKLFNRRSSCVAMMQGLRGLRQSTINLACPSHTLKILSLHIISLNVFGMIGEQCVLKKRLRSLA
jgi:hypothetical protein